ncbi:tRNA uridine-5-carboxymethylaminomethyl(34) synthesis enzyme MnmG [Hanamia caeni]|jgi:tRNA uridine 5-carboxymethylaminomethyl modification enzyme|uniref:tRNA uridine 5-carboxymethylaminomethyl modification enzyme MnmG n=1 Tax=Hanamia caeni TaxID=2294116 RepID=A0A3M9NEV1_9BACT|nr:tRNA uridine-5-carboxymethylaminomethyl(34) synthesis enzyme MnmG [Hanamia caeni]RNI36304.1 tRNA uridine-5-carboxymethylaminomethyl(34) synthesis enzyme MnmG [Hanamia caeni]
MFQEYDVIVVGAGHAGCEAAAASANLGSKTLLITMNMQNMAQMSCNPAMGGIAKGQIVREIDALGGYSGIVSDLSMIQFRMLNKSKGPAMWSPRTQNDRMLFSHTWRTLLEKTPNLDFYQDSVVGLLKEGNLIRGVKTARGHSINARSVVLTNGTFLNGIIHIGEKQSKGGRIAESSSYGITEQLVEWGFESSRLKTGTPPRIDGRSIDYSKMQEQKGDGEVTGFSFLYTQKPENQRSCWITYTNPEVHEILKSGFSESPMFQGRIKGTGPRYCPSIEDKINRFAERERHQLFVEPEGFETVEVYLNGFSSSLSEEVQYKALKKIAGLENCKMFRPGYAIEYDYFPPMQLKSSLETKLMENLFFAGQINGTTGYEEAACQGIVAGINAHQKINRQEAFVLKRNEAYIGVLIDDLINKGTDEPYRMFTSRAEYRTLLRQDNADIRLTEKSFRTGLASEERMSAVIKKKNEIRKIIEILDSVKLEPAEINNYLEMNSSALTAEKVKVSQLLLRPQVSLKDLMDSVPGVRMRLSDFSAEALQQAEIQTKYQVYIQKEEDMVKKLSMLEEQKIPSSFNYEKVASLSNEARQKFQKIKPLTLGQASRISGVNPSDVQILMVYMGC